MSTLVLINTAFPLPAPDIEALIEGRTIAALSRIFLNPGRQFALYPTDTVNVLPIEQYYRSNFLPIANRTMEELDPDIVQIKAWARCELCQVLDQTDPLDILSQLTVWTKNALQETLTQRGNTFLAILRVYRLPQPVEIPVQSGPRFIALPQPLTVTETTPVLGNVFFSQRCRQIREPKPPLHPELEDLQGAIAQLADTSLAAKELDDDIKTLLGWGGYKSVQDLTASLIWIQTLSTIGHSSNTERFKQLVRKSLITLGFSNSNQNPKANLNPEATPDPEGLDFYCEAPYPVVGECQASQYERVSERIPAQLIERGHTYLGKPHFNNSVKIIFATDPFTKPAREIAIRNQMNVIRPDTLQRLVELKARYQGAINLLDLKPCLQRSPFGEEADTKVNRYIDKVQQTLKVRSRLVELVKNYLHNAGLRDTTVEAIHGMYIASPSPQPLTLKEMHQILLELSSPLTGYLGRIPGSEWKSDRFYFLRDLQVD
jgi:hypothetical protein